MLYGFPLNPEWFMSIICPTRTHTQPDNNLWPFPVFYYSRALFSFFFSRTLCVNGEKTWPTDCSSHRFASPCVPIPCCSNINRHNLRPPSRVLLMDWLVTFLLLDGVFFPGMMLSAFALQPWSSIPATHNGICARFLAVLWLLKLVVWTNAFIANW